MKIRKIQSNSDLIFSSKRLELINLPNISKLMHHDTASVKCTRLEHLTLHLCLYTIIVSYLIEQANSLRLGQIMNNRLGRGGRGREEGEVENEVGKRAAPKLL